MNHVTWDGWEDKSQTVHWECVVDSVKDEVEGEQWAEVWKPVVFTVEEKTVEHVFAEGPIKNAEKETQCEGCKRQ